VCHRSFGVSQDSVTLERIVKAPDVSTFAAITFFVMILPMVVNELGMASTTSLKKKCFLDGS